MNIAIIYKHKDDAARGLTLDLSHALNAHGITAWCEENDELQVSNQLPGDELMGRCDVCVVLGGDGTFLHAASLMKKTAIPILGINMGSLGFLTPFTSTEATASVLKAAHGELAIASRFRFDVTLKRQGVAINKYVAANDVVISHTDLARLLELDCWDNKDHMTSYKADGLILATPMGSTAYALAAGGPILSPSMEAVAMVPICPHQLTQRPIVIPSSSQVTIRVHSEAFLTIDGQRGCVVNPGEDLLVSRSSLPLSVFLPKDYSIFNVLRHKLSWGAREAKDA